MKEDTSSVLKCLSLCNGTVQRHIDEMALDVEKTLISELGGCKFAIQLDESTFSIDSILMAYVGYRSASMECIVDLDSKGETIFKTFQENFVVHDIPKKIYY